MADYGYPLPDLRSQILSFKVAQLQNCAGRLGISKSGKKAEVQNRLLCYFGLNPVTGPGDISAAVQGKLESSARMIKDVYCHSKGLTRNPSSSPGLGGPSCTPSGDGIAMNGGGTATNSAVVAPTTVVTNGNGFHHPSSTKIKLNTKISGGIVRCLCKNSIAHSNMVQCSEPSCGVWQHADCIGEAAKSSDNTAFYCEQCRVHFADPFWKPLEQLLPVAKLKPMVGVPPIRDSYNEFHTQQGAELTVYLSGQQLSKGKSLPDSERVIASCLLLEDTVPCRLHWPRNVTMRVNRYPYRVYGRSTTSKMGINQRDEAANIASLCLAGRNTLDIQAVENGTWVILLHRVEARTVNQVKEMMRPVESVSEAVSRVKKLMHDDELSIASQVVSVIDPWSGQRMTTPARFIDASGLQAFDLDSFLSLAQRNRKWQDPTTLKNSTVRQLQVDTYIQKILACLSGAGGASLEVREIVISDQGKWRPEGSVEASPRWFSIEEEEELVKKELREFYSGDDKQAGNGGGEAPAHNTPSGRGSEGVFLSDTESDEEEELRKAASAVQKSAAQAALIGQKRKVESEPDPEVICLLSDSDDDNGPDGGAVNNNNNNNSRTATYPLPRGNPIPVHLSNPHYIASSVGGGSAGGGGGGRNPNNFGNGAQYLQGYPPKTRYPYNIQGKVPGPYPASMAAQSNAPVYYNASSGAAGGGGGGGGTFYSPQAAPPRPVWHNAPSPRGAPPPRPPPAHPRSLPASPGGASKELSQSAQQALAETLAVIHGDPTLMDKVNEDDW